MDVRILQPHCVPGFLFCRAALMESEPKVTYAYEDDDGDDGGGNEEHEQEGHGAGDGAGADEEPSDLPVEPGPGAETEGPSVSLFPLANYSFGSTERGTKVRRRLHLRMIRHRSPPPHPGPAGPSQRCLQAVVREGGHAQHGCRRAAGQCASPPARAPVAQQGP